MKILLLSFLASLVSSCSLLCEHRDWDFIQSVGGINISHNEEAKKIILDGDISGLYQYSHKPTQLHSGIAIKKVNYVVTENQIQFYVITTLVSKKNANTKLSSIDTSELEQGIYQIQYLNPNGSTVNLKSITKESKPANGTIQETK